VLITPLTLVVVAPSVVGVGAGSGGAMGVDITPAYKELVNVKTNRKAAKKCRGLFMLFS
jgi:hypothetical protein